jgi:hypothetical protein
MQSLALSLLLALAARQAEASCAYGTHLHRRQEGAVPVNTFGYTGAIVRYPLPKRLGKMAVSLQQLTL